MSVLRRRLIIVAAAAFAPPLAAQVPVDALSEPYPLDAGASIVDPSVDPSADGIAPASAAELEELIAPVALYPDTLLAVVLPAAAYPLQIVQAARFLDALESDPTLTPPEDWDESVVALLNYPEIVRELNTDLDWTMRLGDVFIAQQGDVMVAVQRFRNRAYAAGNLESDQRQTIQRDDDIIEIAPASDSIIYVPYYEPERVVVRSSYPVINYYPTAYPVYYYPYPDGHAFHRGFFWGVTSAYALGWRNHRLRVLHHSFYGHPYYAYDYGWRWWYRRPSLSYHNQLYFRDRYRVHRHRLGDYWTPRARHYRSRGSFSDVRRSRTREGHATPRHGVDRRTTAQQLTRNGTITTRRSELGDRQRRTPETRLAPGQQNRSGTALPSDVARQDRSANRGNQRSREIISTQRQQPQQRRGDSGSIRHRQPEQLRGDRGSTRRQQPQQRRADVTPGGSADRRRSEPPRQRARQPVREQRPQQRATRAPSADRGSASPPSRASRSSRSTERGSTRNRPQRER